MMGWESRIAAALPDDFVLTVVDVGSAGGLHSRWRPFARLASAILFDPREPQPTGALGRGGTRTYPVALGEREGSARLHLTALPNMSSFLHPSDSLARYRKKGPHVIVERETEVPIARLDGLAARDGFTPDVLKIDTQGSEMLVLRGAEEVLKRVVLAEVEVSFFERYEGQPLLRDIEAFMQARGFELIELHRLKRYRALNAAVIGNIGLGRGQRAGRIAYGDAIFIRRSAEVLTAAASDGGATLLRAAVALIAYGKPDLAAQLFDEGRDLLAPEIADRLAAALRHLGGARLGRGRLHAAIDWLGRHC